MNFFKEYTLLWWEFGLLKISLIALGILIGCRWKVFFSDKIITIALWFIFAIPAIYLVIATLKQL